MISNANTYRFIKVLLLMVVITAMLFAATRTAIAVTYNINTNDTSISDWSTIPEEHSQSDASGDIAQGDLDIVKGWAIRANNNAFNPAELQLVFRVQTRETLTNNMAVAAALDCNDNGSFTDSADRLIVHMNYCNSSIDPGEKNAWLPGNQSNYTAMGPNIGATVGIDNEFGVKISDLPSPCGDIDGNLMIKFSTANATSWCPGTGPAIEVDSTTPGSPMSGINVPTAVDMVELKINLNSNPHQPTIIALIIAAVGLVGLVTITVLRRNYLKNN